MESFHGLVGSAWPMLSPAASLRWTEGSAWSGLCRLLTSLCPSSSRLGRPPWGRPSSGSLPDLARLLGLDNLSLRSFTGPSLSKADPLLRRSRAERLGASLGSCLTPFPLLSCRGRTVLLETSYGSQHSMGASSPSTSSYLSSGQGFPCLPRRRRRGSATSLRRCGGGKSLRGAWGGPLAPCCPGAAAGVIISGETPCGLNMFWLRATNCSRIICWLSAKDFRAAATSAISD